jgi:hypothetical protein
MSFLVLSPFFLSFFLLFVLEQLFNLHPIKPLAANIRNLKDEMNASE